MNLPERPVQIRAPFGAERPSLARRWSRRLIAGLLALAAGTLSGSIDVASTVAGTPQAPAGAQAPVTEFDVNGLKVLVKRREGSLTVAAGLFFRGGVRDITADNAGIEALMLEASTQASANFPKERMRAELSHTGTALSSSVGYDYSVLAVSATRPNFDRVWDLFVDAAMRPSFSKEDVAVVQSRMVASLKDDADDPADYLQRLQERVAYAGHPYANRAEGTAETVARINPEDLQRFHQRMMETSRLLLVVVGDLDPSQLKAKIAMAFDKLPRGSYVPDPAPQLAFDKPSVEVIPKDLRTNYIQGLFPAPPLTSPDIYAMRVASLILNDRVFQEVRVRRNLSFAPSAFLYSHVANAGGIYVTAVDGNQAVRTMLDEITRLQREPLDKDDITSTVAEYLTSYYIGEQTSAAQAGELAQAELIGGGWNNSSQFIDHLRAVTPADVQRVAQRYMRNLRFVVLGNPAAVDKTVFTDTAGK